MKPNRVTPLRDADFRSANDEDNPYRATKPPEGTVCPTCKASFQGGRWRTTAAQQVVPQLSGQRALHREALLAVPGLAESRYGVEVAITRASKQHEWRSREVVLTGVDITSWGADLPGRPRLGNLVRRILKSVPGLKRLRISSIDSIEMAGWTMP